MGDYKLLSLEANDKLWIPIFKSASIAFVGILIVYTALYIV